MMAAALLVLIPIVIGALVVFFQSHPIPPFPPEVSSLVDTFTQYLTSGCKFLMSFVYGDVVLVLLSLLLVFIGVYEGYRFVMWVATKMPGLGVSDD